MEKQSVWPELKYAYSVVLHAFGNFLEIGSEREDLRIARALRNPTEREPQSLRWSLPLLWCGLVYMSFTLAYSTVSVILRPSSNLYASMITPCATPVNGVNRARDLPAASVSYALAGRAKDDGEHAPDHGDDPHGRNPHAEVHDQDLPANQDPPDPLDKFGKNATRNNKDRFSP